MAQVNFPPPMNKSPFIPFPVLHTERLNLRQLTSDDENEVFAIRTNESVARFLDRPETKSMSDVRQYIQKINDGMSRNESVLWVLALKTDPTYIGSICLWNIASDFTHAELGYELLPAWQGKGLMQEALKQVIHFGFETLKFKYIEAVPHQENWPSINLLLRNKFMFQKDYDPDIADPGSVYSVYTLPNPNL